MGVGRILQTYDWKLELGDKQPDVVMEGMRGLAAIMVRTRPVLRGMRLQMLENGKLNVQLRVAGHSRWAIQRDARKMIIMLLRRVWIHPTALQLELVTTPRNGRELYAGEGRTPMTKPPKAPHQSDGRPWDHYEWWGDELPTADPDTAGEYRGESGTAQSHGAPRDSATEEPSVPEAVEYLPPASTSRWSAKKPPWQA